MRGIASSARGTLVSRRHGFLRKLHLERIALLLLTQCSCHFALADPFFSTVDPSSGEGHIIVEKTQGSGTGGDLPRLATIYSWKNGAFLAESRLITNGTLDAKALFAAGTIHGTNWEYRSGSVIFHGKSGQALSEQIESFGGRTPEQFTLDRILGRGLDIRHFRSLRVTNGVVTGRYDNRLGLTGWVEKGAAPFQYFWSFKPEHLPFVMQIDVDLAPLRLHFVPSRLRASMVDESSTNLLFEYVTIGYGPNAYYKDLSPLRLYSPHTMLELDGETITDVTSPLPRTKSKPVTLIVGVFILAGILLALKMRPPHRDQPITEP
jgi:hypothetical protein